MDNVPPVPEPTISSASLETEIPSVVSAGPSRMRTKMIGFMAVMVILAFVVTRHGSPKDSTSLTQADMVFAPTALPSQVSLVRDRVAQAEVHVARTSNSISGEPALLDVRRKSPMVLFNKNQPMNPATASARGEGVADSVDGVLSGGSPAEKTSNIPLPQGFNPSVATKAYASTLGDRETIITQGKVIDALLETAINSEHPGLARALVAHDIYGDSGHTILLPRGSRLVGQYDSGVSRGQHRLFVIWQRAIRPDGIDIELGSAGTDTLGRTGIEGDVNYHFLEMFSAATLLSVIGGAASTVGVSPSDQANSLSQYRQNVTGGFNSAAGTVLGQFVQIKPTITVQPGAMLKVFVARDLYFDLASTTGSGPWVMP